MPRQVAAELRSLVSDALGGPLPLTLRAWDGSVAQGDGGTSAETLVIRNRRALRRILFRPDEVGVARAYVSGDLDVEGDLFAAVDAVLHAVRDAPTRVRAPSLAQRLDRRLRMAGVVARLGAVGLPPRPPAEEAPRGRGRRHSLARDAAAVSHHYDVGNEFYRLMLGGSMVYSCAYWGHLDGSGGSGTPPAVPTERAVALAAQLDRAQHAKLELVARKLQLDPGDRLLDIGCGWGSMVLHAAREHGVRAVGVTLSHEQAELARKRVAEEGLQHLVDIRVQDYRDVADEPFDAISSIGMAEHVGQAQLDLYAHRLHELVRPGGRVLNHAIAARKPPPVRAGRGFIDAYVFPDGELLPLAATISALGSADLEVRDVHALREHYALTLRAWVHGLEQNRGEAVRLVGEARTRVWLLYMVASALAFEADRVGIDQVLAVRPAAGRSGFPLAREDHTSGL